MSTLGDADDGYLTVDGAYAVATSPRVVEHLSRWMIQPGREHSSIHEKPGLWGQPITRVAYNGELAAGAAKYSALFHPDQFRTTDRPGLSP